MSTITFVTWAQERIEVAIKPGTPVMETAIANEVPGIEAQCYGAGICGTCHVYVSDEIFPLLTPPTDWEKQMLGCIPLAGPKSRLSCQIKFEERLAGAEFQVPERQEALD